HARGIVHRDIKPENIFLVRDPEVPGGERAKLLDFGIAKLMKDTSTEKTNEKTIMGTPTWMSPEQCRGAGLADQRSENCSLGCVLFRRLGGRPPFASPGSGDLIIMHVRDAPPVPSSLVPALSSLIDQLVLRCLAKDPAQRFASGSDLANAIAQLLTDPGL